MLVSNGGYGVHIQGETADSNIVVGNLIGLSNFSTAAGNALGGILIEGGADNNALGTSFCYGPTVAGNLGPGVTLKDAASTGNQLQISKIGLPGLANQGPGVLIDGAVGSTINQNSQIRDNTGDGVRVVAGTGNRIASNLITSNGRLGINLVAGGDLPNGVSPNDIGDGDPDPQ